MLGTGEPLSTFLQGKSIDVQAGGGVAAAAASCEERRKKKVEEGRWERVRIMRRAKSSD